MAGAAKKKTRPPFAMVERADHGRLRPVGQYDAVIIDQAKPGSVYDLVPRRPRSNDQNRLYWMVLTKVVEATGLWAQPEYLHEVLMRACGYVRPELDPFTGKWIEVRDSIAFNEMPQEQMNDYFEAALAKLSETLEIDVLDLLPPKGGPTCTT
jgi:hypothetical protein